MESRKNTMIQGILIVLVLFLLAINLRSCKQKDISDQQLIAATDSTVLYRNQKNQLVAEKTAFVGDRKAMRAEVKRWKDTLASEVTKNTKVIIQLKREIKIANSGKVKPPIHDTVLMAGVIIDAPSISIDTGDAFHNLKFAANKSKYAYEIEIKDLSELKIDDKGKRGTLVTLLNKNPYVRSTEIKSVVIEQKKPSLFYKILHVAVGLGFGYLFFK
jgi:hypothetical protein